MGRWMPERSSVPAFFVKGFGFGKQAFQSQNPSQKEGD
jgi:hypothetical protein